MWRVSLLLLAACGSGYVKLDPKKVRDVKLVLVGGGDRVCPNAPLWPEVVAVIGYEADKVLETNTPGNPDGKVRTSDLAWSVEVGTFDDDGIWLLPWDLFPWHDRRFSVRAHLPADESKSAELQVTPRYDCEGVAEVDGLDGRAGRGDGEPGGAGPRVEIALAYVDTELNGRLVLVRVIDHDLGRRGYHLVDPRAAKRLTIDVDGGAGGAGGPGEGGVDGASGARGVDGQTGGMCQDGQPGSPGYDGGDGTDGQPGGRGGDGGDGGDVVVTTPPGFPELARAVDISVAGGEGGAGGSGGRGGQGGAGGPGGRGGSAGPTSDPGRACTTSAGADGREGARGRDGQTGATGPAGQPGRPGSIALATAPVEDLFAVELARGWKIVR